MTVSFIVAPTQHIWNFFLAWAVTAGTQGTAACFQVVMNKNLNEFDRDRWVGSERLAEHMMPTARRKSNGHGVHIQAEPSPG